MLKLLKWSIVSIMIVMLSACTTSYGGKQKALNTIAEFARGANTTPTVQDYIDAGVIGVDASNLDRINAVIAGLAYEDVDTIVEIQTVVDGLGLSVDTVAPVFTSPPKASVAENQTTAITLIAIDNNSTVTYSISGGDSTSFEVNSSTGVVRFVTAPDYETKFSYNFTATATDTAGSEANQSVTIAVTNVMDNVPSLATPPYKSIDENTRIGTTVVTLTTNGANSDSNITDSFNIVSGNTDGDFNISNTGVVTVAKTLDYETTLSYTLKVEATNSAGDSNEVDVNIIIGNVIENAPKLIEPTYITDFTYSGDANWTEDNTTYYTPSYSWKNKDINDSQSSCMEARVDMSTDASLYFAYKVSSEDGFDKLKFYIDNSEQNSYTGEIDWTPTFYSISSGLHTLRWCYIKDITASYGDDTAWVDDIKVGDIHYTLPEDKAPGVIGNIGIVPQNDAVIDSITINGNGSDKFKVANDGRLFLVGKLDYETQRVYILRITAHNAVGASNTVTITVEVTDVDDLYITHAFYDDNATPYDMTDDKLYLQYSSTLDTSTIKTLVSNNFVINSDGSMDTGDSRGEYNASLRYYPHIITLDGAYTLREQNISIAKGTLESYIRGVTMLDNTKTPIRVVTGSRKIKKTGEIKSYNESGTEPYFKTPLKDDGYYQSGIIPHYTRDDATEIVIDHITGLMWQDDANVSLATKKWLTNANYSDCINNSNNCENSSGDTAATYCENLTLGGFDDWRLPTSVELEGIVDYGRIDSSIDSTVFHHTSSEGYWSFTSQKEDERHAWYVNFSSGYIDYYSKNYDYFIRCVRTTQ